MKRNIRYIVVHCTATPQNQTVKTFLSEWGKGKKHEYPPFHYIIEKDGEAKQVLHEAIIASGDFAHNSESVHVAYIGGTDKEGKPTDNRTEKQKDMLFGKLAELSDRYPHAEIVGKKDLCGVSDPDPSPCFDVKRWMENYLPDLSERPYFETYEFEEEAA